jgi:hypothetical protein
MEHSNKWVVMLAVTLPIAAACSGGAGVETGVAEANQDPTFNPQQPIGNLQAPTGNPQAPTGNPQAPTGNPQGPGGGSSVQSCAQVCSTIDARCSGECFEFCDVFASAVGAVCGPEIDALLGCVRAGPLVCDEEDNLQAPQCEGIADAYVSCVRRATGSIDVPNDPGPPPESDGGF